MEELEGENVLLKSKDESFVLTNVRVYKNSGTSSRSSLISIFLEKISSIEIHYKSKPIFLIIATLVFLAGLIVGAEERKGEMIMLLGIVLSALFVLLFFITRKHVISIKSDGGNSIDLLIKKMKSTEVKSFINKVEDAKNKRYLIK